MPGAWLDRDGALASLWIDRPQTRNAISGEVAAFLSRTLGEAPGWDWCHALFIRGGGDRAFVAGGDLKELGSVRTEDEARRLAEGLRRVLDGIEAIPFPVVAAVNGHALGGGAELALACDFRVMVDDARIGFVQSRLGLVPAWGSTERLTAVVGRGRALYLLTTGRELEAEEAQRLGLVEEVVSRADLEPRLAQLGAHFAETPRPVLAALKRAVASALPYARPDLEAAAVEDFARAWAHPDHWAALERATRRRKEARR